MESATKRSRHPKVFISYCQASQSSWVVDLASRLREDGVHVVIDVWNLKPGGDMYSFMERMVVDRSVSKVLIVCDKEYQDRSNKRRGGVGIEA